MLVDVVSDLHVDYWSDFVYDWKKNQRASTVIIAGDIADTLDLVIDELNKACDVYDKVLYVDGNHESTHFYNDLDYANRYINEQLKHRNNFFNLSTQEVVFDDIKVVVMGVCGWWDFRLCEPEITFENAVAHFSCHWNPRKDTSKDDIVSNLINVSKTNYEQMKKKIIQYRDTYNICMVTHTIPTRMLLSPMYPTDTNDRAYCGNSLFEEFLTERAITHFIYGHSHDANVKKINGKVFINNARGRPKDFNRKYYVPYTIQMP